LGIRCKGSSPTSDRFLQLQKLDMPPSPVLQEDRQAYVALLMSQSSQAASWMSLIYSSDNVDFRHCFLESTISKGMHYSLAVLGWKLPYSKELWIKPRAAAEEERDNVITDAYDYCG